MNIQEYTKNVSKTESDYAAAGLFFSSSHIAHDNSVLRRNLRLLHAAIGMSTESSELLAIRDSQNLKEELGDFLWYCGILGGIFILSERDIVNATYDGKTIQEIAEIALDSTKKAVFYGFNDRFSEESYIATMRQMAINGFVAVAFSAMDNGWTLSEIMESNIAKLKARYPNKFSAESAHSRNIDAELRVVGQ